MNCICLNQFLHLCVVFAIMMCQTREITTLLVNRAHSYECYINLVERTKRDKMQREKVQWISAHRICIEDLKAKVETSALPVTQFQAAEVHFLRRDPSSADAELLLVYVLGKIKNNFKI